MQDTYLVRNDPPSAEQEEECVDMREERLTGELYKQSMLAHQQYILLLLESHVRFPITLGQIVVSYACFDHRIPELILGLHGFVNAPLTRPGCSYLWNVSIEHTVCKPGSLVCQYRCHTFLHITSGATWNLFGFHAVMDCFRDAHPEYDGRDADALDRGIVNTRFGTHLYYELLMMERYRAIQDAE
jgi:hypothetical protein